MPVNFDELQEGSKSKRRRDFSGRKDKQREVGQKVNTETNAIVQQGFGTIASQMVQFDEQLTNYELQAAEEMADRLLQSPFRVQAYLLQTLKERANHQPDFSVAEVDLPDLTSNFLDSAAAVAGFLPM